MDHVPRIAEATILRAGDACYPSVRVIIVPGDDGARVVRDFADTAQMIPRQVASGAIVLFTIREEAVDLPRCQSLFDDLGLIPKDASSCMEVWIDGRGAASITSSIIRSSCNAANFSKGFGER